MKIPNKVPSLNFFLRIDHNVPKIMRFFIAAYSCEGCLHPSARGNSKHHATEVSFPTNSPFMKLATLPRDKAIDKGITVMSAI